ncbi:diguanylate cyclase [Paenibacillus sp. NPDC055715]
MCVTSSMYIWAIMSSHQFTLIPIAKDGIFESMREGVLVLDRSHRLIDYNKAAKEMVPELRGSMLGQTPEEIWFSMTGKQLQMDYSKRGLQHDMYWRKDGEQVCYQIRLSSVHSKAGLTVGTLVMLIDITEQRFLQEQLKQMAYFDGLTKIHNRSQFLLRSRELLEAARTDKQPISFILFDVDHFKRINDTYGHDTGDLALIHLVQTCLPPASVRPHTSRSSCGKR